MRILIINEYIKYGGTEIQTQREINNYLSHNDDVFLITFDKSKEKLFDNHFNIPVSKSVLSKIISMIFPRLIFRKKLKKLIKKINPDYIHLNNVFNNKREIYNVIKDYKCIQTIRDYSAVCPKSTCIKKDYSECDGYFCNKNCNSCRNGISFLIRKRIFIKTYKRREKSINKFVCPSQALTDKCKQNGYNIDCLNNPFDYEKIIIKEKKLSQKKTYLYYGLISEIKGVLILLDVFKKFAEKKEDVELIFVGNVDDKIKSSFFDAIDKTDCIKYVGPMKNSDILKLFSEIYCTIVPSLWIENYPNTVLESKANLTLVIGTNRGGISEMIHNENLLFDILNKDDFLNKLEYTYTLPEDKYFEITKSNQNEIIENNTLEKYYQSLNEKYKEIGAVKNE